VYLAISPQPDCASAWLESVKRVNAEPGHEASNVVIDVADPTAGAAASHPIVERVNDLLTERAKPVETIANTIFPLALYQRHGMPAFINAFHTRVLSKVRKSANWSGYYFERMTRTPVASSSESLDQLSRMIARMNDQNNGSLNKYEIALFDPDRDANNSPYGGQCLSFLSFHLKSHGRDAQRTLLLTAQYRNHYYIEKLLGNLIGLGRLMAFVAAETGTKVGALTVVSTHAEIDSRMIGRQEITQLIEVCTSSLASAQSAA
jgi:hypothetical protein